jgi:hypothetical protein
MRGLSDRENQNILNLAAEEAFEEALANAAGPVPSKLLSSSPAPGVPPSPAGFS